MSIFHIVVVPYCTGVVGWVNSQHPLDLTFMSETTFRIRLIWPCLKKKKRKKRKLPVLLKISYESVCSQVVTSERSILNCQCEQEE